MDPPPSNIDAIWLTLPAAEQFAPFKSLLEVGKAEVLRTTPEDQTKGFPRFVVTGVVMGPQHTRGPLAETKLVLSAALQAVAEFNHQHPGSIRRLAFCPST
jgi:hypothetical protein